MQPPILTVARAKSLAFVEREESVIVLPLASPNCSPFVITGGGVTVWHETGESPAKIQTIVESLGAQHPAEAEEISNAVNGFFRALADLGIVVVAPADAGYEID